MSGSINETTRAVPAITAVETAVPVFIGYTEKTRSRAGSLQYKPMRIATPAEYTAVFGLPHSVRVSLQVTETNTLKNGITVTPPRFLLAYAVQHYFANGGGPCFVISAGTYKGAGVQSASRLRQLQKAVAAAGARDHLTLLCLPDATLLSVQDCYTLLNDALRQCGERKDRFALLDVPPLQSAAAGNVLQPVKAFRSGIGTEHLFFGAAFYPWLRTALPLYVRETDPGVLQVSGGTGLPASLVLRMKDSGDTHNSLYHVQQPLYNAVMAAVKAETAVLPPCGAVAAIYCRTDKEQGVWKAPANVALAGVLSPQVLLSDSHNDAMNVDAVEGKSVNAIRSFPGRGVLLWGARTLAGNDNEWRYVPVRRFFLMVEESVRKGTAWAVFEPNESSTWTKIVAAAETFLLPLWRQGALQGVKQEQAFYVACGLGRTMTEQDIEEGRLVLEMGLAVLRPAEFMVLRITHRMAPA